MPLPSVFSGSSRLPFNRPETFQTLPQASKATTLTATCPCHLFFREFKTGRLTGLKPSKRFRRPPRQQLLQLHALRSVFQGVQACPFASPQNPPNAPLQLPIYMLLPNSYTYMPLPSVFQGVQDCRLPGLNPPNASAGLQGNNSYSYMPLPSVFQGVQDCRLTGLKPSKRFRRPPRQQLLQLHAPAICFSGSSRLPFDRPETLQTLPQASEATTLTLVPSRSYKWL